MQEEIIVKIGWLVKYSNKANETELIKVIAFEKQGHNDWRPLIWDCEKFKIVLAPETLNGKSYVGYFPPSYNHKLPIVEEEVILPPRPIKTI